MKKLNKNVRDFITNRKIGMADEEIIEKYPLTITWSKKDNAYIITCSKLPGLLAFGDTKRKAIEEAKVALKGILNVINSKEE